MKRFVEGTDRGQSTLFPECLADWIDQNNPVQVIDAFVDELDLAALGFDGVAPEATGRPSYHPSVLLKLYIIPWRSRATSAAPNATRRHAPAVGGARPHPPHGRRFLFREIAIGANAAAVGGAGRAELRGRCSMAAGCCAQRYWAQSPSLFIPWRSRAPRRTPPAVGAG
jgi:hypothetical protein